MNKPRHNANGGMEQWSMRNEMFEELIENSNDVIVVTDRDFQIRYISSSVSSVFGVEPVAVVGKNAFDYVSPDKVELWKEYLEEASFPVVDEISLQVEDHDKAYFDIYVSNLLDHYNVEGFILKLHDVTKKKQREKELIRSNEHLDQVIYKTTHDLKAPLMSSLGLVRLAEKAPAEEKDQYIGLIKKSLLKLDSYIEEMNNFFRNEKLALQREQIDLRQILQGEQDTLKTLNEGQKIQIFLQLDEDVAWYSDLVRVKTVIANLFSNAIKYYDLKKTTPYIKIISNVTDDFCDICIEDNGIGIAPEYKERIFDLFFRATDQSQGTGLGLFIVKDTVERLKGSISVKSTVGKGTTFFIRIPNQLNQPVEVE